MRTRILVLSIFLALIATAVNLESGKAPRKYVENVSTLVCPAKNGAMTGDIYLSEQSAKSALIDGRNRAVKKVKKRTVSLSQKGRVVSGGRATPTLIASKPATWLALSQCNVSSGEFWFVGGTSDVTSLGYFQFVNENLGKAIIDVELWSEDGSESLRTLTIPPRTTKNYPLTTFMPGKKRTVFHIVSRSGLIKATLFDERRKGLMNFGGDYVAPSVNPKKNFVIPGIPGPNFVKKSKITSQKLRLFAPGESDAIIKVTYISSSGVFAPIGLDSLRIPAQKVVEVDLSALAKDKLFTINMNSSEPIVAGVLTRGNFGKEGKLAELAWSSSADAISGDRIALVEQTGWLSIITQESKVSFNLISDRGKRSKKIIRVDSMALWKVPVGVRQIELIRGKVPVYLGFAIANTSGIAALSLAPTTGRELTTVPIVDSRLFIPTQPATSTRN